MISGRVIEEKPEMEHAMKPKMVLQGNVRSENQCRSWKLTDPLPLASSSLMKLVLDREQNLNDASMTSTVSSENTTNCKSHICKWQSMTHFFNWLETIQVSGRMQALLTY